MKNLDAYEELVSNFPDVDRLGKTMPYTSINGHMYSFLTDRGTLGLRLAEEDRMSFMVSFHAELMIQHNRVMKEFVEVPEDIVADVDLMVDWFEKSLEYTTSLKPKK